jgi:Ca2+-binding EF-hand superfamily protein
VWGLLWCAAILAELTTTMKELGDLLTAEEISTFVSIMDKNADGVVGVSWSRSFIHVVDLSCAVV